MPPPTNQPTHQHHECRDRLQPRVDILLLSSGTQTHVQWDFFSLVCCWRCWFFVEILWMPLVLIFLLCMTHTPTIMVMAAWMAGWRWWWCWWFHDVMYVHIHLCMYVWVWRWREYHVGWLKDPNERSLAKRIPFVSTNAVWVTVLTSKCFVRDFRLV